MTNFERAPALTTAPTTETLRSPWNADDERLSVVFASTGGPEEVFDYYQEAAQRVAANETEDDKINLHLQT